MRTVLVLAIAHALTGTASAGLITINETELVLAFTGEVDEFNGTDIPTDTTLSETGGFNRSNTTEIDFFEQSGQTVLNFGLSHQRGGGNVFDAAGVQTVLQTLRFTVNADTTYEVSGEYGLLGFGFDESVVARGQILYWVELFEVFGPFSFNRLFFNEQQSFFSQAPAENETFVLGETEGNLRNTLVGNLTGNLIAGHVYELEFNAAISNSNAGVQFPDEGASALGTVNLTIGTAQAIPEPSSLAMLGMGGLALMGYGWRRRKGAR